MDVYKILLISFVFLIGCVERGLLISEQIPSEFENSKTKYGLIAEDQIVGYVNDIETIDPNEIIFTSQDQKENFKNITDDKRAVYIIEPTGGVVGDLKLTTQDNNLQVTNFSETPSRYIKDTIYAKQLDQKQKNKVKNKILVKNEGSESPLVDSETKSSDLNSQNKIDHNDDLKVFYDFDSATDLTIDKSQKGVLLFAK